MISKSLASLCDSSKKPHSVWVMGLLIPVSILAMVSCLSFYGLPLQKFLVPYLVVVVFAVYHSGLFGGMLSASVGFAYFIFCRYAYEASSETFSLSVPDFAFWVCSAIALILLVSNLKVHKDILDSLMQNLPAGVYIKESSNLEFVKINSQGSVFFGLPERSLIGKNARDFFSDEQANIFDSRDREILKSGISQDIGLEKVFTKNHGDRFVRTKKWPLRASNRKNYLLVVCEDVTERTCSEIELRSSEMKFRSLVQSALDAVVSADLTGKIISWNKSAETLFGYSETEVIGKSLQMIMPERAREIYQRDISQIAKGGNSNLSGKILKLTGLTKAGKEFALEMAMAHWFTDDSEIYFTAILRDISESLKQSDALEAKVLERTRDFALLSEVIPQLVWSIDADGNGIYFNQRWIDYTGISLDLPGHWEDVVHADDVDRSKAAWSESLTSGLPFSMEYRLRGPDNLYRWHLSRAVAIKKPDGSILKWVGTSTDIQGQIEAKEHLLALKQLTDSVIQDTPVLLWAVDRSGVFTYYDGKVGKTLGLSAHDRIGKNIFDLYAGVREIEDNVRRALLGETISDELQIGHVFLENKFTPQFDSSGNINGVVGLSVDITEKRRQYQELQKFENIFQFAHWGMAISSPEDIFLQVNSAFAKMHGSSVEHWIGRSIQDVLAPEARNGADIVSQLDQTGHISHESIHVREDKTKFAVLADVSNVRDDDGTVLYRVANYIDLTDKKTAEEARAKAEIRSQMALEASRIKSEFLATMSHEIRTPLNGVIGMINLLLDTSLTDEQKNYGKILLNSADTLLALINDILDLSKAEAGKIDLDLIDFDLTDLVSRLQESLRFSAEQKGLKLQSVVDKDLPQFIQSDPVRLQQILLNLVNNAIKFTSQGHVKISVQIISFESDKKLRFEVSDTGIGISEESIYKMFLAFSQADASTTRKFGGTGLGLSICKHLVKLMDGSIGVESSESTGSTFWFEIPFKIGQGPTISTENSILPIQKVGGLRILLAEDLPVNQMLATKMLEKMGHTISIANNGAEAIATLSKEVFDLVLMDCSMPVLDGYEATKRIRAGLTLQPEILILAMTANAMAGDREKCLSCGMNDYISKPIKFAQLAELIDRNFRASKTL